MAVHVQSNQAQPEVSETTGALVIPKPAYNLLFHLTGEPRPDVSLSLALKDLVRLKTNEARSRITAFERKYGANFAAFEEAWKAKKIQQAHSYAVEQDYWEWEAATTDLAVLEEMAEWQI